METFGERLAWARETAGLSQGQLARQMGFETQMIQQIEEGEAVTTPSIADEFAQICGMDTDWLLTGHEREVDLQAMTNMTEADRESLRRLAARRRLDQ